jgi:hypothetical protein
LETQPFHAIHPELELHYNINGIIKSPYYDEARIHLGKDLSIDVMMPEELSNAVNQYNECVNKFLNETIPSRVMQTFRQMKDLTLTENPNFSPPNSVLLPFVASNIEKYLLSDGKNNPELFYQNGRLSEGHDIKTLATIPQRSEARVRKAIEYLKLDSSLSSILYGSSTRIGLRNRRNDLINNGNQLADEINKKIIFEIERETYTTICNVCEDAV